MLFFWAVFSIGRKKIKEEVVLRSKHILCFSNHIIEVLPQKGGSPLFPALA